MYMEKNRLAREARDYRMKRIYDMSSRMTEEASLVLTYIYKAAQMLDVSADYLLGLTDVPSSLNDSLKVQPEEKEAVLLFHDLNPEGKKAAMAMLKGLSSQNDYTLLPNS